MLSLILIQPNSDYFSVFQIYFNTAHIIKTEMGILILSEQSLFLSSKATVESAVLYTTFTPTPEIREDDLKIR